MSVLGEAVTVTGDLLKYYLTGSRDMVAFERWRSLHCQTNGLSTDILNRIVELFSRRFSIPESVSGIAGTLSSRERACIIEEVNREGVYIFPDLVDSAITKKLRAYAFSHESEAFPPFPDQPDAAIFNPLQPHGATCWHPEADLFENETVQTIIADPSIVALAAEYLKVPPHISILALWHSSHRSAEPSGPGAQLYHFDLCSPAWVKFFLFLSDVTPKSGPHAFVRRSHRRDPEGTDLRARGIQRIADLDVVAAYGAERISEITGPTGTLFMADTRAWHKGVKPEEADRLLFQVEYANCLLSIPSALPAVAESKSSVIAASAATFPELFRRFKLVQHTGVTS